MWLDFFDGEGGYFNVECQYGELCDGHVIKASRKTVVAMLPRKYARIDLTGKKNNTLGEYVIVSNSHGMWYVWSHIQDDI